jgi:hypothetical protein
VKIRRDLRLDGPEGKGEPHPARFVVLSRFR